MTSNNKNSKIITYIKKLVKKEVSLNFKKSLKPLLENMIEEKMELLVETKVHQAVSENLMKILLESKNMPINNGNNSASEQQKNKLGAVFAETNPNALPSSIKFDETNKKSKNEIRNKIYENLGISNNPEAQALFEDTEPVPQGITGGSMTDQGYIDSDDAGVDLSRFGI